MQVGVAADMHGDIFALVMNVMRRSGGAFSSIC